MTMTIGVVGLGNIGSRLTNVLLEKYTVFVFDIDENRRDALTTRGAAGVTSAQAVGNHADVVLTSLPDNTALDTAILGEDGVLAGCNGGEIIVDTSTVSPTLSQDISDECQEYGVDFLDAPVSGGARNAETGSLTIFVGGDESTFERVRDVFETIGETIHHIGPNGAGAALKVINNYLFGMNQLVLCEGILLARAAGIDDEVFAATVSTGSGHSYALDRNMERFIIPEEYESEFTLSLMRKDLHLGEQLAGEYDVPLLVGGGSNFFRAAETFQDGDLDSSAILKLYERLYEGPLTDDVA